MGTDVGGTHLYGYGRGEAPRRQRLPVALRHETQRLDGLGVIAGDEAEARRVAAPLWARRDRQSQRRSVP